MLDYFGQSPIIVRSSSLLEDNYGNAFAGKYESVFCANQGPHQKRLQDFLSAVKTDLRQHDEREGPALPRQRGLLDQDEQMSLLVQRVSGVCYGGLFYPQVAGVGLRAIPTFGTSASIRRPAWCGWCSAWARGRWTVRTTTTRASSR